LPRADQGKGMLFKESTEKRGRERTSVGPVPLEAKVTGEKESQEKDRGGEKNFAALKKTALQDPKGGKTRGKTLRNRR